MQGCPFVLPPRYHPVVHLRRVHTAGCLLEKSKNILLITLQTDLSIIGLKHIHYYLLQNDYQSHLLHIPRFDPDNEDVFTRLQEFVSKLDPLFIGISLMSTEYEGACEVSGYLKKHFPDTPIVWGGIHPTISPETSTAHADYVCVGEGEKSVLDLANAFYNGQDPRAIPNLCYRENGEQMRNPLYPLIENIDELPFCDHIATNSFLQEKDGKISKIDIKILYKYGRYQGKIYDVMTSFGCHLTCTYCCSPFLSRLYGTGVVRKRSVENIILELENAVRDFPFVEMINFQDENFLCYSPEFIKDFCDEYRSRIKKPFMIASTPLYVNREKVELLEEAGLIWARAGLQSGSDRVCAEIYKRKSLPKHFLKAARIFNECKIAVYCDVILDNPFENDEDKLETVKVLMKTPKPFYLQLYSLSAYYGTLIHEKILSECPEKLSDSKEKDYYIYEKNTPNTLIRLAPYVSEKLMSKLVQLYEKNSRSMRFRTALAAARILSALFFEPLSYFKSFKLSQRGSYGNLFRMISIYLRMALTRYSKHYK